MQTNLDSWQRLGAAPGIGPVLFRQLVKRFGSPERVLAASIKELCSFSNIDEKRAAAIKTAANVSVWTRATSLGSVESLIEHRASIETTDTETPRDLLRLSVGIEDVDDLFEDLDAALRAAL